MVSHIKTNLFISFDEDMTHIHTHVWRMVWRGRRPARVSKSRRRSKANSIRVPEVEAQNNSSSSPSRSPGAAHTKNDVQVAYGVRFGRYLYGWKDNFMELPMEPVPP